MSIDKDGFRMDVITLSTVFVILLAMRDKVEVRTRLAKFMVEVDDEVKCAGENRTTF